MARGNKKSIPSDSDNNSDSDDDELHSYDEIMQENLKYAKAYTSQQKKLKCCKKS